MLSSRNRLKKKINFARIEIDGSMYQSKSFGMGVYNRADNGLSHFGFIISTKISKKAVVRNRIKRIMSEVVRKNLDKLNNELDVVFLIKPLAVKITRDELESEVYAIITKNLQSNIISNS